MTLVIVIVTVMYVWHGCMLHINEEHYMYTIHTCRSGEFQGPEADVVERFIVEDHAFVGVLDELVDGERGVIRLHDSVRDLWGWEDGEGEHHAVRVFFTDFGDEEGAHAGASATTKGMTYLETYSHTHTHTIHTHIHTHTYIHYERIVLESI